MSGIDQVVVGTQSEISKKAKASLVAFMGKVDSQLNEYFEEELKNLYGQSEVIKEMTKKIWEHIREHNLRPAKRLRASFMYYGYKLFGGTDEKMILRASMSIELIHTGLLMHDDFMDQDEVRRGLPTTHKYFEDWHKENSWQSDGKLFGESMAVNAGDVAMLAGFEIFNDIEGVDPINKKNALKRLLRGIVNTGVGQSYDVLLQAEGKASDEDIFNLHVGKTGIYTYETPLIAGAILTGANEEGLKLLSEYSRYGGVAFQIQDDVLGVFGDSEVTGKSDNSDIKQRKVTLLSTHVLANAADEDKKRFLELWGKRDLSDDEATECREIIVRSGSLEYSRKIAVEMARKALESVERMKQFGLMDKAILYLEGIAVYMIEREL